MTESIKTSKKEEAFDFSYKGSNQFDNQMLNKHKKNLNEKYHVY